MKGFFTSSEEENEEYEVEEILDRKINKGVVNYKVKWKGYPLSESSKLILLYSLSIIISLGASQKFDKSKKSSN